MLQYKGIAWGMGKESKFLDLIPRDFDVVCTLFSYCYVINYNKLSGLNNTNLSYSAVCQKSNTGLTGLKSGCEQGHVPFWSLQRRMFSCPFLLLETAHILWLMEQSSILKASNIASFCAFPLQSHFPQTDSHPLPAIPFLKVLVFTLGPPG